MTDRLRWRQVLAGLLGAVALVAVVVGGVQATGGDPRPAPAAGATLPLLPPLDGVPAPGTPRGPGVPAFAPSALVPVPVAAAPVTPVAPGRPASEPGRVEPDRTEPTPPRPSPHPGDGFDPSDPRYQGSDDPGTAAGREPTSGETQREWVCRQDPSLAGC